MDANPDEYGLIGYPLGHSFSKKYFSKKFSREGINAAYNLYPMKDLSNLRSFIGSHPHLQGLNVTIPFKQEVIKLLDGVSDECREIGAANVIKICRCHGKIFLYGFNSDAIGFRNSIEPIIPSGCKNSLILGTGGAAAAVKHTLTSLGIDSISVSRTPVDQCIGYPDLKSIDLTQYLIIVNCTPLGMWPLIEDAPPIPYESLSSKALCYDLVYNPSVTEFMRRCANVGATVKNGLEMLYYQAEAAWDIWTH